MYILHGGPISDVRNNPPFENMGYVSYSFFPNKHYQIFFEVFTETGAAINISHYTFSKTIDLCIKKLNIVPTATYDVQTLSVGQSEDGLILKGTFISNSTAEGSFVVFQGPLLSADIFRAFLKVKLERGQSLLINPPPGAYTVYGYDLEANHLPSTSPAVVLKILTCHQLIHIQV